MLRLPPWLLARPRGLVSRGALSVPMTLTRAQVSGVESSATAADGSTLSLFGADVARFNGEARRLLIEGQRTNSLRNSNLLPNSGTSAPTNWSTETDNASGYTRSYAYGTENGLPYVDWTISGTPTSATYALLFTDAKNDVAIAYASGASWTQSADIRIVSGSLANISLVRIGLRISDGSGSFIAGPLTAITPTSSAQRFSGTGSTASNGFVTGVIQANFTTGQPINVTLRISNVQLEAGAFASTLILPASGAAGPATRGADIVTATLASLAVPASGACTVLWSGMIPQAAPSGINQNIARIDDGTTSNTISLRNGAGSSNIDVLRVTGGSPVGALAGTMTAGTPFRAGLAVDGAGRVAGSFNGGAVAAVTGAPTSGLTTLRLGADSGTGGNLFGETAAFRVLPYVLSDTDLQAAVAAMPT